jgi:hypothetical protein
MTTELRGLTSWANLSVVFQIARHTTAQIWKSLSTNWPPQQLADFLNNWGRPIVGKKSPHWFV